MLESAEHYMEDLSIFRGFSSNELSMLAMLFRVKSYKVGEFLCKERDGYASFFVIVSGEVASFKRTRSGRLDLGRTGADRILGHKSLLLGGRRSASMVATEPCVALECNRADFQQLLQANSPFAYKVMDVLVNDLAALLRKVDHTLDRLVASPEEGLSSYLDALLAKGIQ